jgi:hypothetical protein
MPGKDGKAGVAGPPGRETFCSVNAMKYQDFMQLEIIYIHTSIVMSVPLHRYIRKISFRASWGND